MQTYFNPTQNKGFETLPPFTDPIIMTFSFITLEWFKITVRNCVLF